MSFCLWITGLPGSGKSSVAKELTRLLRDDGIETATLSLDEIRKVLTPEPKYTEQERDLVYRALAVMAQLLVEKGGKNVIIDATGNRRAYRELARQLIPEFAEAYLRCPLETAMAREGSRRSGLVEKDLYKRAVEGRLEGKMPGVSTPYEEPTRPEVTLDSAALSPREAAAEIRTFVASKWFK